jgi:hypothetical protein
MALVVLVLWLFTAGAGIYLLVTSNLARIRPAAHPAPASAATLTVAPAAHAAPAARPAPAAYTAPAAPPASTTEPASRREMKRAARKRFDPPSLVAARNAPLVPGARSLLEFAHPACGIVGVGFWLGFTFVHYRTLGWIAFGLVALTASLGLTWFAANTRAAKRRDEPGPSFSGRLIVLHGGAAALTVALAALAALVLHG